MLIFHDILKIELQWEKEYDKNSKGQGFLATHCSIKSGPLLQKSLDSEMQ